MVRLAPQAPRKLKIRSLGFRGRFMGYKLQTDHGPFGPAGSQEKKHKEFGVQGEVYGIQTSHAPWSVWLRRPTGNEK